MDGGKHFSFEQYKLADATRDRYKIILGQCKSLYVPLRFLYCILRGQIKGFNCSITTIMCEDGSYRTVVG